MLTFSKILFKMSVIPLPYADVYVFKAVCNIGIAGISSVYLQLLVEWYCHIVVATI